MVDISLFIYIYIFLECYTLGYAVQKEIQKSYYSSLALVVLDSVLPLPIFQAWGP